VPSRVAPEGPLQIFHLVFSFLLDLTPYNALYYTAAKSHCGANQWLGLTCFGQFAPACAATKAKTDVISGWEPSASRGVQSTSRVHTIDAFQT
jgi:hypothetical protein